MKDKLSIACHNCAEHINRLRGEVDSNVELIYELSERIEKAITILKLAIYLRLWQTSVYRVVFKPKLLSIGT